VGGSRTRPWFARTAAIPLTRSPTRWVSSGDDALPVISILLS
jgi:hypothetical protein